MSEVEAENGDCKSKIEDYEVIEQIGRGAFGAAFLVLHKSERRKYVMKKIRLNKQTEKFTKTAHQEMDLISRLNHPYVVEYKDAWVDKTGICIVTAYCEGGDMAGLIRKARGAYLPEEVAQINLKISNFFISLIAVKYTDRAGFEIGDLPMKAPLLEAGSRWLVFQVYP